MSTAPGTPIMPTPSGLRAVITEALDEAERTGMTRPTLDEWVSIRILASRWTKDRDAASRLMGAVLAAESGGDA